MPSSIDPLNVVRSNTESSISSIRKSQYPANIKSRLVRRLMDVLEDIEAVKRERDRPMNVEELAKGVREASRLSGWDDVTWGVHAEEKREALLEFAGHLMQFYRVAPIPGSGVGSLPGLPQTCWCGGDVGDREPGDENGQGCWEDIYHDWKNPPNLKGTE